MNEKELAPHQLHQSLIDGSPGFSHWDGTVLFSPGEEGVNSLANSAIRIECPVRPPAIFIYLMAIVLAISTNLLGWVIIKKPFEFITKRSNEIAWITLVAAASSLVITIIACYPDLPIVSLDGLGYISWGPKVPIGYPLFITAIVGISSSLKAVIVLQVICYCIAVLIIYRQLYLSLQSTFAAYVTALMLMGAGRVINYNLTISTDGIFATMIILYFSSAIAAIRTSYVGAWVAAGSIVALSIYVRPVGYFLLVGLIVLYLLTKRRRIRYLAFMGGGFFIAFIAMSFLTSILSSSQMPRSILGLALMPHVIHLLDPDARSAVHPEIVEAVSNVSSEYRNAMNKALNKSWTEAYQLETNNFNPITQKVNGALSNLIDRRINLNGKTAEQINTERTKEIIDVYERLAYHIVLNDPLGYLKIVAVNLQAAYYENSLITYPAGYASLEGASLRWWFDETRGNALIGVRHLGLKEPTQSDNQGLEFLQTTGYKYLDFLHYFGKLLPELAALSAFYLLVSFLIVKATDVSILLGIYALVLHFGATLLVCLSTVAIPRYSVPIDVLLMIAVGCAINLLYLDCRKVTSRVLITIK